MERIGLPYKFRQPLAGDAVLILEVKIIFHSGPAEEAMQIKGGLRANTEV